MVIHLHHGKEPVVVTVDNITYYQDGFVHFVGGDSLSVTESRADISSIIAKAYALYG